MSSGREESPWVWLACAGGGWLRSPDGVSGDEGQLKTSKSSLESETSTIPSSSLVEGWDKNGVSSEETWDSNTYLVQAQILCLDYAL
nr:hypothetical protein CFP56_70068 [Quercus suber]